MSMPLPPTHQKKNFALFFQRMILLSKKLLHEELIETSFPIKKGYIHFRHQTPLSQEGLGPQKQFFAIFSENTVFLEKLLNYKIFST